MPLSSVVPQSWYEQDVVAAARAILGKRLIRRAGTETIQSIIVEAEAYRGEEDLACHARSGRTPRTAVMYGPPGHAYVYFTYGMHWMLNIVCGPVGFPAAVLIRAILPITGADFIAARRFGQPSKLWTDGPGKLTRALDITGELNGCDLSDPDGTLWIENGVDIPVEWVVAGPRVGLNNTPEPWLSMPWRFRVPNPAQKLPPELLYPI